jgi:hypothetical protein
MGSTETGEMFTQEQYDAMTVVQRAELGLVRLNTEESKTLEGMNRKQRRDWLRKNKKLSRRSRNVKTA